MQPLGQLQANSVGGENRRSTRRLLQKEKRPFDKRDANYWFDSGKSANAKIIVKEMSASTLTSSIPTDGQEAIAWLSNLTHHMK